MKPAMSVAPSGRANSAASDRKTRPKRLPSVGDCFDHRGWTFEVVDMDGRKIDKLLITPQKDRA